MSLGALTTLLSWLNSATSAKPECSFLARPELCSRWGSSAEYSPETDRVTPAALHLPQAEACCSPYLPSDDIAAAPVVHEVPSARKRWPILFWEGANWREGRTAWKPPGTSNSFIIFDLRQAPLA